MMVLYSYEVGTTPIEGEGKPWFPREYGEPETAWLTKLLDYDELYSKASEKVESLIRAEAGRAGLKPITSIGLTPYFRVYTHAKKVDGKWDVEPDEERRVWVGDFTQLNAPKLYMLWPEFIAPCVEFGMTHENNHTKDAAVDAVRMNFKRAIEKYGTEKFNTLSEDEQLEFLHEVHESDSVKMQTELIVNEQVVQDYRNAGLDDEGIAKKIAPAIWFIGNPLSRALHEMSTNEREGLIRTGVMDYAGLYFPHTVSPEKVANEAIEIDREYRKKLCEHPLARRAIEG